MKIVILGGGQAGGWAARTIAGLDQGHEIVLVGDETHPPYERPPLSKEVLSGAAATDTYLWKDAPGFDARHGVSATRIDRPNKQVSLSDGEVLAYDRLILTLGGRVRRIDRPHAHYLRTIEDALAIGQAMTTSRTMLVIGGGWIGLEVAAAARQLGLDVVVVEAADRLASRVMPPVISRYLHDLHERHGVTFHYRATAGDFASDLVVVGIGIVPNVELAADAGLAIDNGIAVDEYGRTSDPDIFAAGDVASLGGIRTESWANAQNQAIAAAKSAVGVASAYRDIPWFWSNQYEVNFQFLGTHDPGALAVLRGDPATSRFSVFFLSPDNFLQGVAAINAMGDIRAARKLMALGLPVDPAKIATEAVPLSQSLAAEPTVSIMNS